MTDAETIARLAAWCDSLRRQIQDHISVMEEEKRKLTLALSSWQEPSEEIEKEKSL